MDIKARNLASTGLEHGLQLVKSSFSSYSSPIIGNFNKLCDCGNVQNCLDILMFRKIAGEDAYFANTGSNN